MTVSEADTNVSDEHYGITDGIDMKEIDEIFKLLFDETFEEIIEDIAEMLEYELNLDQIFTSKTALTRDISTDGNHRYTTDRLTAYLMLSPIIDLTGKFPAEGTYTINDGESTEDFLKRVFIDNRTQTEREVKTTIFIGITLDISATTSVNINTGELEEVDFVILPLLYVSADSDISFEIETDDSDNLKGLTINYNHNEFYSNVYANIEIDMTIDDLNIIGEGAWTAHPTIVSSVKKAIVSADLVNEIWPLVKGFIGGDGKISGAIPDLIKKILTSTDRKLDVFKTIESLTNSPVPDMIFTGNMNVTDTYDELLNEVALITISRPDEPIEISYPLGNYAFDASAFIGFIPDDVLSPETKLILVLIAGILGWDYIELSDLSKDKSTAKEVEEIRTMVEDVSKQNEEYSTTTPTEYIVITAVMILVGCILTALMWRGRI